MADYGIMLSYPTNKSFATGFSITIGKDLARYPELLIQVINEMALATQSSRTKLRGVIKGVKYRATRWNLFQNDLVFQTCMRHDISEIELEMSCPSVVKPIIISIEIRSDGILADDKCIRQLDLRCNSIIVETMLNDIVSVLTMCFEASGGISGFGLASTIENRLITEMTHIMYKSLDDFAVGNLAWHQDEIRHYSVNSEKLDKYIQKFYWANWLNAEHMRRLVAIPQAKLINWTLNRPLPSGGAYLQVGESPYDFKELKKRLDEINAWCTELRLPGAPIAESDYG